MNNHTPVKIPKLPGKIFLDRRDTGVYVKYLLGREYDRGRGFYVPEYKMIGVQLEHMPGLMLPNNNYEAYFDSRGIELSEPAPNRKTAPRARLRPKKRKRISENGRFSKPMSPTSTTCSTRFAGRANEASTKRSAIT